MTNRVRPHALTLIELLVVIGIIAVLLALLLPVVAIVRENGRRTVCAKRLQEAGIALRLYADANHGRLPQHPLDNYAGNSFPHQLPRLTMDALVPPGAPGDGFFCPSGVLQPDNAVWDTRDDALSTLCATGYHWLFARLPAAPPPLNPPKRYHPTLASRRAAEEELAADAVISFKNQFVGVGGEHGGLNVSRTSHLRRGDQPAGGNILFHDGHVSWRAFEDMQIRGGPNDVWF